MDKELIYTIRKLYEEKVLTPKLIEGELKTDLLDGLEDVLRGMSTDSVDIVEALPIKILDKKIDYEAIQNLIGRRYEDGKYYFMRLKDGFKNQEIESYRDLVRYATQRQRKGRLQNLFGVRSLDIPDMGMAAYRLLYVHLNSLGIHLFDDGYRPTELSKY